MGEYNDSRGEDSLLDLRPCKPKKMKLPIKFPSAVEVITEEAARFRALSPEARLRSIRGLIAAGALMIQRSPKAAFLRAFTMEKENQAQQAIKEFIARHAR
jgi:hypothetical protein